MSLSGRRLEKLHNEMLHDLYFSPSIIRVISSRTMRWTLHVALMGEKRRAYRVWSGKLKGIDHSEGVDVGGRII